MTERRFKLKGVRLDIFIYYGMQVAMMAVPFVMVPFFARVLGPEGLGLFSQGQALAGLVTALVEFGFQITGTRQVAANRTDIAALTGIATEIQSGKVLMAVLATTVVPVCFLVIPVFHAHPEILIPSVVLGLAQGMSFYWLFGGMQRYYLAGGLDLGAKLVAAGLTLLFVRDAVDSGLTLGIFAGAQIASVILASIIYSRLLPMARFNFGRGKHALIMGRHVFIAHIVGTFYSGATPLLLGLVANPAAVGLFSGAEKLVRAALMPLMPFRQVFFPIVAERIAASPEQGEKFLWRLFAIVAACAVLGAILLAILAEPLVQLVLGAKMAASTDVLHVMTLLIPISVGIEFIANFWMLSMRQDRLVSRITVFTCIVHISLVLALGAALPPSVGAGLAIVLTQAASLTVYAITAWRHHPLRHKAEAATVTD